MEDERFGVLTTVEITRIFEYLRSAGLTGEQIYEFWAYVATGHKVVAPSEKEK